MNLPDFGEVLQAADRIRGEAVRTPLIYARAASEKLKRPVYVKPECLQRTGSFKFRGAFNCISQITAAEAPGGVVAVSSGNHAQGVAAAAKIFGLSAKIVMPQPRRLKVRSPLGRRSLLLTVPPMIATPSWRRSPKKSGGSLCPPMTTPGSLPGRGPWGWKSPMMLKPPGLKSPLCSRLLVVAGWWQVSGWRSPSGAKIYAVEPEGFDDTKRSLAAGERLSNTQLSGSICDAILTPIPGELTFALNQNQLADVLIVSDVQAGQAVAHCFKSLKLVVEPGGAVAMAAVLQGQVPTGDGAIIVVLSGGNVDEGMFAELVRG